MKQPYTKIELKLEHSEFLGEGAVNISAIDDEGIIYHGMLYACEEICNCNQKEE